MYRRDNDSNGLYAGERFHVCRQVQLRRKTFRALMQSDNLSLHSSIYGFVGIVGALFLATVCVINERKLEVRFAKIDAKRGGSGFV